MAKKNFYAVVRGRKTGIYTTWFGPEGAESQVAGFEGAVFKGFATRPEAENWFQEKSVNPSESRRKPIEARSLSADGEGKPVPGKRRPDSLAAGRGKPASELKIDEDTVIIYTDGGSTGNPGPGGYGAVILADGKRKELSGGYRRTTNNRMELTAVIEALKSVEGSRKIRFYSDSQYVVRGMNEGWAKRWRRNGWMRTRSDAAENPDLWSQLLDLAEKHEVEFVWVKGHAGNPQNERCDQLAVAAAQRSDLPVDAVYEASRQKKPGPPRFNF